MDNISGNKSNNCQFCIEVLLDFGGVNKVTILNCRKGYFNIGGVSPQMEEYVKVIKNNKTFRYIYKLQQEITSFLNISEVFKEYFRDILLKEIINNSQSNCNKEIVYN